MAAVSAAPASAAGGETAPHRSSNNNNALNRGSGSAPSRLESRAGSLGQRFSRSPSPPHRRDTPRWWTVRLFRGMANDVYRRAPFYRSDWTDAWDYRVVPATVYMYFAKYGDALQIPIHGKCTGSMLCYCCHYSQTIPPHVRCVLGYVRC